MRRPHRGDARQLVIDWTAAPAPAVIAPITPTRPPPAAAPPVQVLPWDFRTTFPPVLADAIEAGTVAEEDAEPEALAGLHVEHAGAMLAALRDADRARDARRRGVDPATGKVPRTAKGKRELPAKLDGEVSRLDSWQQTLLDTYEEAFGPVAAEAFGKYARATHAGVEVRAEAAPPPAYRVPALPNPVPLRPSVRAGVFGLDEQGTPIDPGPEEVEAITEQHAETLTDLIGVARHADGPQAAASAGDQVRAAVQKYAEDFGQGAADELLTFCRRQSIRSSGLAGPRAPGS